jgi:hypothetical protein
MDIIPDDAGYARLLARLYDVADTFDDVHAERLRAALEPPYALLSFTVEDSDPVVIAVSMMTEAGAWNFARLDAASVGLHLVGGELVYVDDV